MVISYNKEFSFRAQFGDFVLDFDKNTIKQWSRGKEDGFTVAGPGEYEIKDVYIKGLQSAGADNKINTIYTVGLEGMNICFAGALSDPKLPAETKEAIDGVDILFVPVDTMGPSEAYKFAVSLEPSIIIPMNYTPQSLKAFLKEGGSETAKPADRLTLKKKDLEGKEGEIVVLEQQ